MRRRGQQPKDHARDNVLAIREAQRQLQIRKEEEEELAEAENRRFKLAQFEGVEARFMTAAEKAAEGASKKQFLKRTSSMGPPPRPTKPHQARPSVKPPVPKVVEAAPRVHARTLAPPASRNTRITRAPSVPHSVAPLAPQAEPSARNFIRDNAREAVRTQRSKAPEAAEPALPESFGRTPEYLERRKAEWAEQERRRLEEEERVKGCPDGMMLLPEAERVETLEALRKNILASPCARTRRLRGAACLLACPGCPRCFVASLTRSRARPAPEEEVRQQLMRMPLVVETRTQIKRKETLEAKLSEVEDAIRIFSRPKVFVKQA